MNSPLVLRVALIGSNGMLAGMVKERAPAGVAIEGLDLPEFDLTDRSQVLAVVGEMNPDVMINCAAYTNVDGCETEQETAMAVNGDGPGFLTEAAKNCGATLVHISTDYLFDGSGDSPLREDTLPNPQSVYGRSKLAGELAILDSGLENYLIVRTSWLYGPGGKNFVETILRLAGEREQLAIVADQIGSPTYTGDLAEGIFRLLTGDSSPKGTVPYGIYHFADAGQCSWYQFACAIVEEARQLGLPLRVQEIRPLQTKDYPLPAKRPAYSVFDTGKYRQATGRQIPEWRTSLREYLQRRPAEPQCREPR